MASKRHSVNAGRFEREVEEMRTISDKLRLEVESIAMQRVKSVRLEDAYLESIYLAGSSLLDGDPNDLDFFPVGEGDFSNLHRTLSSRKPTKTRNALTCKFDETLVQFCYYHHDSLETLVESFDYSHVQIGVKIAIQADGFYDVVEVYLSDDHLQWRDSKISKYTGSEFPLSSLIRFAKYVERGVIDKKASIPILLGILADILNRGFDDYEDFKDQLDAVDLGLLPSDLKDVEQKNLITIFDKLSK